MERNQHTHRSPKRRRGLNVYAFAIVASLLWFLVADWVSSRLLASALGTCTCGKGSEPRCGWDVLEMKPVDDQYAYEPPDDECGFGQTVDAYLVQCRMASIDDSSAYAFDDCIKRAAQARVEKVSNHWIRWTHTNPCANCVGLFYAEFSPEVHVCSNMANPADSSYAMVAASMGVESSLADIENHSTDIFPGLACEASSGSPSGMPEIRLSILGQTLVIPFSAGSGPVDVGLIKPVPRVRYYNVTAATQWEIQFSFSAGLGLDVYANGWSSDAAEGWAYTANSSWGFHWVRACCGWGVGQDCCGYESNPDDAESWWWEEVREPDCELHP